MSLVSDYFAKTQQYKDEYGEQTLLLMQVGAFFEVYGKQDPTTKKIYGSKIVEFSQVCDLIIAEKKARVDDAEVVMAGFKDIYLEKYVKRLQDAGFTIPVYVQDESSKGTTRSLYQIFSPGTYFSEDSTKITNTMTCIWFNVIEQNSLFSKISNKKGRTFSTKIKKTDGSSSDRSSEKSSFSSLNSSPDSNDIEPPLNTSQDFSDTLSKTSQSTSGGSYKMPKTTNEKVNKMIYVGIANIDIYTGTTSIFEYSEQYINNPTTFDELDRIISIHNPSETILIGNINLTEMNNIVNYANIQSELIHKVSLLDEEENTQLIQKLRAKNCEKQIYQKTILEKFYNIIDFNSFMFNFNENTVATQAFCYLLDFIYQHNPNLVNKISEPVFENCSNKLILANHSLKQLNIIDDNNYTGKHSSIVKMLNNAITSMGKRKFTHCILSPITNIDDLNAEYAITEHLLDNVFISGASVSTATNVSSAPMKSFASFNYITEEQHNKSYDMVKTLLGEIGDISKCMRQIIIKRISPKSIYKLYHNLTTIINLGNNVKTDLTIINYLKSHNINLQLVTTYCNELLAYIQKHFNLDVCKELDSCLNFECNFINNSINDALDSKLTTLMNSNDMLVACQKYFNGVLSSQEKTSKVDKNVEYVKIHETEKNNFTLVATKTRCKTLKTLLSSATSTSSTILKYRSSFNNKEYSFEFSIKVDIVDSTSTNSCITNDQIKDMCKNITTVKLQLKDVINATYLQIVNDMSRFLPQLEDISNFVASVDVIYTKAYIAKKYNYCRPIIDANAKKSFVDARELRHCLIEQLNQSELYVANNIEIGKITEGVLLYGTNAVGKTSFIRAIGIAVVLAQAGLYVPASSFIFKPYQYLFTRIIGNDNIFKGLSTFAVEMSELRIILRLMNENSLILGDELCSGTESISAVSIFVAGIQKMYKAHSSFIFATHLHEIVNFDEITSMQSLALKHMAVVYDRENDMLIYDRKLRDGPGQNMYGLEVCKSLSLPEDFLKEAYNIRIKYHPECDGVLAAKTTHFNAKKVKSAICEYCKKEAGAEVHHLQHQQEANSDGLIVKNGFSFNKNNLANLITVCETCHEKFHNSDKQHKKVKTSKGTMIVGV